MYQSSHLHVFRNTSRSLHLKRLFDLAITIPTLIILIPAFVLISVAIKLSDGGPVFFRQTRIGRSGCRFTLLKFRSMVPEAEDILSSYLDSNPSAKAEWAASQKLANDPRITVLGNFLRKSSLDELPQLINIFMGHMSIVGPRPITEKELTRYGDKLTHYLSVMPGLTGLWQVSGRSDCKYAERVQMDVEYANTRTAWLDLIIILRTIPAVIFHRGSY